MNLKCMTRGKGVKEKHTSLVTSFNFSCIRSINQKSLTYGIIALNHAVIALCTKKIVHDTQLRPSSYLLPSLYTYIIDSLLSIKYQCIKLHSTTSHMKCRHNWGRASPYYDVVSPAHSQASFHLPQDFDPLSAQWQATLHVPCTAVTPVRRMSWVCYAHALD